VNVHAVADIDGEGVTITDWPSTALATPVRMLVVDDHGIVREGLAALLDGNKDIKVVGLAATGAGAVLAARRLKPAMIIMDLMLPDLDGIDATRRILGEFPQIRVIALSASSKAEHVYRALRCGARGYVLKAALGADLLLAVQTVAAGSQYTSPSLSALAVDGVPRIDFNRDSPLDRLSAREHDVLRAIVAGSSSADIALDLCLSRKTVDTYRSRLMAKLGVSNRSALVRFALQHDLPPV
jgi:DNA-binding NarL/FixJ family response regulator